MNGTVVALRCFTSRAKSRIVLDPREFPLGFLERNEHRISLDSGRMEHTDACLSGLGDGRQSKSTADVQAAVARVQLERTGEGQGRPHRGDPGLLGGPGEHLLHVREDRRVLCWLSFRWLDK